MDIEGAEFAVLRHLIATGTITRIRRLYVEGRDCKARLSGSVWKRSSGIRMP
jgi:hypothetical protein